MADNTQNQRLIDYLESGKKITSLQAWRVLGFSYLPARIKDVRNMGHDIKSKRITVKNRFKEDVSVNQYWMDIQLGQQDLLTYG